MIFADKHYILDGQVISYTEYDTVPDGDGTHWAVDVDERAGTRSPPRPCEPDELTWVVYFAYDQVRTANLHELRNPAAIKARIAVLRAPFAAVQAFRDRPAPDDQALTDRQLNAMLKLMWDELELLARSVRRLAKLTQPDTRTDLLDDTDDT